MRKQVELRELHVVHGVLGPCGRVGGGVGPAGAVQPPPLQHQEARIPLGRDRRPLGHLLDGGRALGREPLRRGQGRPGAAEQEQGLREDSFPAAGHSGAREQTDYLGKCFGAVNIKRTQIHNKYTIISDNINSPFYISNLIIYYNYITSTLI